jgi:large conductance mechanosensitive channel
MLKEFKEFALKGNMLDMAIGIVIGAAFGTVIKSLVDDLLMPVVSSLFNAPDFTQLFVVLRAPEMTLGTDSLEEFRKAGGVAFAYGNFINALIAFLLVAFALYIVVKNMNKLKKKEEAAPAPDPGPSEIDLLKEIRDSLKK